VYGGVGFLGRALDLETLTSFAMQDNRGKEVGRETKENNSKHCEKKLRR
jgi:hypothetical protein